MAPIGIDRRKPFGEFDPSLSNAIEQAPQIAVIERRRTKVTDNMIEGVLL
jgi:hypothetical protein